MTNSRKQHGIGSLAPDEKIVGKPGGIVEPGVKQYGIFKKIKRAAKKVFKSKLGKAIIDNQSNLKTIIKIVHPIVRVNMNNFFKKNKNKKIVVLDIPLLMENKINKKNYILVFVDAKKKENKKRLRKRPNYNPKIYYKLKKLQLPLEFKKKKSDFVVKNNFKSSSIKKNVKVLKNKILRK